MPALSRERSGIGPGVQKSRNSKPCVSIDKVAIRSTDQFQRRTINALVVAVLPMLSKKIIMRIMPSRRQANMDMNPSISAETKTSDIATATTS